MCDQYRIHILNWKRFVTDNKMSMSIYLYMLWLIYILVQKRKLLFLQRKCYMLFDIFGKFISEPLQSSKQFTFSAHYIFSHSMFCSMQPKQPSFFGNNLCCRNIYICHEDLYLWPLVQNKLHTKVAYMWTLYSSSNLHYDGIINIIM